MAVYPAIYVLWYMDVYSNDWRRMTEPRRLVGFASCSTTTSYMACEKIHEPAALATASALASRSDGGSQVTVHSQIAQYDDVDGWQLLALGSSHAWTIRRTWFEALIDALR